MMDMPQGDAGMPEQEDVGSEVTIKKLQDGSYEVSKGGHEAMMEGGEAGESYPTAMEACQAAIALLDGGSDADAEIMQGYNGPSKQMNKVGIKEVFGG